MSDAPSAIPGGPRLDPRSEPGFTLHVPTLILNTSKVRIMNHARIDSFVKIEGGAGVVIERHVHIASFCHVNIGGGHTVLGAYSAMASGSKIISGANLGMDPDPDEDEYRGLSLSAAAPPELQNKMKGRVFVASYCLLGVNSVVLPNCVLAIGTVIGAGAVLPAGTWTVPWGVYVGVPAVHKSTRQEPRYAGKSPDSCCRP